MLENLVPCLQLYMFVTHTQVTKHTQGVDGYEALKVRHTEAGWGGLEYNTNEYSLLDGSSQCITDSWFYAIGVTQHDSIPCWEYGARSVELWVNAANTRELK